ncbi:hypothetical protein FRB94_013155 [Tulasnella sp. JGI-2019a]|nr:hypothetical protein FRB94_013155 [Tulasnella sp. JGI-2019a]
MVEVVTGADMGMGLGGVAAAQAQAVALNSMTSMADGAAAAGGEESKVADTEDNEGEGGKENTAGGEKGKAKEAADDDGATVPSEADQPANSSSSTAPQGQEASAQVQPDQQQQLPQHPGIPAHPQYGAHPGMPPHYPHHIAMPAITRGVPILFVRTADGVGYHSGREIACEHVLGAIGMSGPGVSMSPENWTLRVL